MKNKIKSGGIFRDFINYLENYEITPLQYILVFLSISFIRNFLEGAMEITRTIGTGATQETTILQMGVLFNLEWLTLFAALAVTVHLFTKSPLTQILKLMLFFFAWIIIVPFLDLAAYYPSGCKIDYLYTLKDYIKALMYFFVPGVDVNICFGIRLEVFAAFLLCWAYVFMKTKSALKSFSASLLLYFLAVSSMAYPVFILLPSIPFVPQFDVFVNRFFFEASYGGEFLRRNSSMIFILLAPLLFLLHRLQFGQAKSATLIKSFFTPASIVMTAAFFCGFLLAPAKTGMAVFSNPYDYFLLLSGMLTCLTYGLYLKDTSGLKPLYFTLVLITSMALSFGVFLFFIFLFTLHALYCNSPFKLDTIKIFNNMFLPLNASLLFLAGYSLIAGGSIYSIISFTVPAVIFCILLMLPLVSKSPGNSLMLLLLFVFFALTAPAAASLLLLIPAVVCGGFLIYIVKSEKIKSEEHRYGYMLMSAAILIFITAFFGR